MIDAITLCSAHIMVLGLSSIIYSKLVLVQFYQSDRFFILENVQGCLKKGASICEDEEFKARASGKQVSQGAPSMIA